MGTQIAEAMKKSPMIAAEIEQALIADFTDYVHRAGRQFGINGYRVLGRHMAEMAGEFAKMVEERMRLDQFATPKGEMTSFTAFRVTLDEPVSPPEAHE